MNLHKFKIKVGGDFACFTNPGLKVERCSYPVITPGAARGLLESIFWKPEFRWEIREIKVLKPIRQISVMRNEIESRQGRKPLMIERRQQRTSLILKNVAYVLSAEIILKDPELKIKKYSSQFKRKLEKGGCHHTPYLGTREFAAWFEPACDDEKPEEVINLAVGQMLFDIAYCEDPERKEIRFYRKNSPKSEKRIVDGYAHALYFPAIIKKNVLKIPCDKYSELYKLEGMHHV